MLRAVLVLAAALGGAAHAAGGSLVALAADGSLRVFPAERPAEARVASVSGLGGRLVGIDFRPADGLLWGLTADGDLYRIDVAAGRAALASTLTSPFDAAGGAGVDFTPQNDRLRLLGRRGQNLRVQVVLGAAASDAPLAYAPDDANAARRPAIVASAYDNNVPGAPRTMQYGIDGDLDVLVRIDPPNDGRVTTVGPLGVDVGPEAGFEIVTEAGADTAFLAAGGKLHRLDLATGSATPAGDIGPAPAALVGLARLP